MVWYVIINILKEHAVYQNTMITDFFFLSLHLTTYVESHLEDYNLYNICFRT